MGTLHLTSTRDWALFEDLKKNIKPVFYLFVMIANSPHYSPYFKRSCPPGHNVIFFLHHQVHDALNDVTMTPPWCYNNGTYMSFKSLTRGRHICRSSPVSIKYTPGIVILGQHASTKPINSSLWGNQCLITKLYSLKYKVTLLLCMWVMCEFYSIFCISIFTFILIVSLHHTSD